MEAKTPKGPPPTLKKSVLGQVRPTLLYSEGRDGGVKEAKQDPCSRQLEPDTDHSRP